MIGMFFKEIRSCRKHFRKIRLWHLKPIQKTEKESVNLATQVNHHYVASLSLIPVHSKVTKPSNYTPYFTN